MHPSLLHLPQLALRQELILVFMVWLAIWGGIAYVSSYRGLIKQITVQPNAGSMCCVFKWCCRKLLNYLKIYSQILWSDKKACMKEYSLLDTVFSKTCVSVCTIELWNSIHLGTNGGQPSVVELLIFFSSFGNLFCFHNKFTRLFFSMWMSTVGKNREDEFSSSSSSFQKESTYLIVNDIWS